VFPPLKKKKKEKHIWGSKYIPFNTLMFITSTCIGMARNDDMVRIQVKEWKGNGFSFDKEHVNSTINFYKK